MITNKQAKILKETWDTISYELSNIDWTNYGDRLLELCVEESKSHDNFRGESIKRGLSIQQEAKYFAVKRLWEYVGGENMPHPKDYFTLQKSCYAAYSIMTNDRFADSRRKFIAECKDKMQEIAKWDYCDLISNENCSPGYSPDERRGFKRSPVNAG